MYNYTGYGKYDGGVTINGYDYSVKFTFTVYGYYSPGCIYLSNGDPGDPPEDEIVDVIADWDSCEPAEEGAPQLSDEDIEEALEAKAWELAEDGEFEHD